MIVGVKTIEIVASICEFILKAAGYRAAEQCDRVGWFIWIKTLIVTPNLRLKNPK